MQRTSGTRHRSSLRVGVDALLVGVTLAILFVLISSGVTRPDDSMTAPGLPTDLLTVDEQQTIGTSRAPIVLVEFADFECPYCRRFALQTMPRLKARYIDRGAVQLLFRNFPLDIHRMARPAAIASACAAAQGRFAAAYDWLFAPNVALETAEAALAPGLGLDIAVDRRCLEHEGPSRVAADTSLARSFGIRVTPTFYVGKRTPEGAIQAVSAISGAAPIEVFEKRLDVALASSAK